MTTGVLIGLEVHAYLATNAKLFCRCDASFLAAKDPNANVCPVCTAQPGAKPMAPNRQAIESAVLAARMLGCAIEPRTRFLRKHYFYPDLPTNYQRTSNPVGRSGDLLGVAIREVHVEEDPGTYELRKGEVDWNRSGAPLIEIVTDPVLTSPKHAREWMDEMRLLLAHLEILGAAGLKADANISTAGGERVEIKNVNSSHNVELALSHERERQERAINAGDRIARETRHFDETRLVTVPLRAKESEEDYRYIPDPDLGAIALSPIVESQPVPEHPFALRTRWVSEMGVTTESANVLLAERPLCDAYRAVARTVDPRLAFDFVVRDVKGELNYRNVPFRGSKLDESGIAKLVESLSRGELTRQAAREALRRTLDGANLDSELLARVGVVEKTLVGAAVDEVFATHADAVSNVRGGKTAAMNFLVGETMKRVGGRARPEDVRREIERRLGG